MGAWIETEKERKARVKAAVASYVGAWIETNVYVLKLQEMKVASYVGAWIETLVLLQRRQSFIRRILCGCVDWNLSKLSV